MGGGGGGNPKLNCTSPSRRKPVQETGQHMETEPSLADLVLAYSPQGEETFS